MSKISACIITYNQENYIINCLEGALTQIVSYEYEIVIGDDCSSDKTTNICKAYAEKYSHIIKYIRRPKNIGFVGNWINTINECNGNYIALCEGDDYWTDPRKLQKQVDFLETNSDFSICFHRVYEKNENSYPQSLVLSNLNLSEKEESYSIKDLACGSFFHTPSVVFRNKLINSFPDWFYEIGVSDYPLYMLLAMHGKIKYFPQPMAVYRIHKGGVWSTKNYLDIYPKWRLVLSHLVDEFKNHPEIQKLIIDQIEKCTIALYEYNSDALESLLLPETASLYKKYILKKTEYSLLLENSIYLSNKINVRVLLKALILKIKYKLF